MAELVHYQIVQKNLRIARGLSNTPCLPGYSLFDAIQQLRAQSHREEYLFLMRLAAKVPLLSEVGENVRDRFLACEARTLTPPDGEPLVFCAITDGIAIGFPSSPEWNRDRVTVHFDELLPDATIHPTSEEIDQLTRAAHAAPIRDRHRERLRRSVGNDPTTLWENRETAFPDLSFGPGVQDNLMESANLLDVIVGKLAAIDQSAREWRRDGGPAPSWKTKVTPESQTVMSNPALRETRRFRSCLCARKLFAWHARFGGSGRIHLRFSPESHNVEIGYIGPHLPL